MITSNKISSFVAGAVVCVLFLTAGCAHPTAETAKTKVKPEEQKPTAQLALKFTPRDSTTYRVMMEEEKGSKWEGALPSKPSTFKGGHTGNRIEMTFTQRIQSTDDRGNAVAEITIKELKYLVKVRDKTVLDFDSSREEDRNSPLGSLIGQSYTIETTASGRVSKVIDVSGARAAVTGSSSADKRATALLSADAIKERHTIPALPVTDKSRLRPGDNWSNINTFFFDMMGSKSYERIYTLQEIKDTDGHQVAIAEMKAVPSAEMAKQLHKEQATSFFAQMFDNTETYTGELKFDLTTGKVEKCVEELRSEWLAVDPSAGQGDEKPDALRLTATRLYCIERID